MSDMSMEQNPALRRKTIKKEKNMQALMELIQQQKGEIENLKATQATGVGLKQLVTANLQAMSCLNVSDKKTPVDGIERVVNNL